MAYTAKRDDCDETNHKIIYYKLCVVCMYVCRGKCLVQVYSIVIGVLWLDIVSVWYIKSSKCIKLWVYIVMFIHMCMYAIVSSSVFLHIKKTLCMLLLSFIVVVCVARVSCGLLDFVFDRPHNSKRTYYIHTLNRYYDAPHSLIASLFLGSM